MKISRLFSKSLSIFLVLTFVLSGVGGAFFISDNQEYVAKVGKRKIYAQEYVNAYENEIQYIQQLLNQNLSNNQIKDFNIRYSVLNKLIEKKLLLNFVNSLNLKIGKQSIEEHMKNVKYFQDNDGKFDKKKFDEALSNAGINEAKYVQNLESSFPIVILMNSLFGELSNSYIQYYDQLIEAIYKHRYQLRVADIIKISRNAVEKIPQPTNDELVGIYEKNKKDFIYPEYRTISYLVITPEDVSGRVVVDQQEIDMKVKEMGLTDQRDVINLVFNTEEEAKLAMEKIKNGVSFETLVSELNRNLNDITLENVTRNMLPDNIRNEVFSLKEGENTEILQSVFGWHIMKLKSIHSISKEDLNEVSGKIESMIKQQKAATLISDIVRDMDEEIKKGASFEEIASKNNLKINIVKSVNVEGLNSFGNKVNNIPSFDNFLSMAFSRALNEKGDFVSSESGAYFNVYVSEIIPSRNKTFEESKPYLVKMLQDKFVNDELYEVAKNVVLKFKSGTDIEKMKGVSVSRSQKVYRTEVASTENPGQNYPFELVDNIFSISSGSSTEAVKDKDEILIAVLRDIQSPNNISNLHFNTIKDDIGNNNMEALREEFIKHLMKSQGVEVNNSVIDRMK